MTGSIASEDGPERAAPERAGLGLFERLDGWNPIFLKDLAAAMRGKIPAFILCLCLLADVVIVLDVLFLGRQSKDPGNFGPQLMEKTFATVVGFTVTLVPLQAFITTVMELRNKAAADLALAGASAPMYVFGRIQFAFVEILLVSSLFAPLFACAHNLGGVDVSEVVLCVGSALLIGTPVSAFAISLAAHARFRLTGALLPVLLISAFWIGLAAIAGGAMLGGLVSVLPRGARMFVAPLVFSACAVFLLASSGIMVLGMPGDRWSGAFPSVSAASIRKQMKKMREKQAERRARVDRSAKSEETRNAS